MNTGVAIQAAADLLVLFVVCFMAYRWDLKKRRYTWSATVMVVQFSNEIVWKESSGETTGKSAAFKEMQTWFDSVAEPNKETFYVDRLIWPN